jgi:hypothetical protein
MENARSAMEKIDPYLEGRMDMQQREPERWDIAETLMTLAQTLTDLANDANPVELMHSRGLRAAYEGTLS